MTKRIQEAQDLFKKNPASYRSGLSVNCAIFGYINHDLKILLNKNQVISKWFLPTGFVKKSETLEQAASRTTIIGTGINNLFLKQFKTFSKPGRALTESIFDRNKFVELAGFDIPEDSWIFEESIGIGFYALTDIIMAQPEPDLFSSECTWFSVDEMPEIGFDHAEIIAEALLNMRINLYHYPIGKNLLQPQFTISEIKRLYEVLSGKKLNTTNFTVKLVSLGLLIKTGEKKNIGAHRSPNYYRFNDVVYEKALKSGMVLI